MRQGKRITRIAAVAVALLGIVVFTAACGTTTPTASNATQPNKSSATSTPSPPVFSTPKPGTSEVEVDPTYTGPKDNQPPKATISGPTQVKIHETVAFTASATDPDGDDVTLSWTNTTEIWDTKGVYPVMVLATDSRGLASSTRFYVQVNP